MIVDVSTVLNCSATKAWNEVQKSSLLLYVIWPLARFVPSGAPFPERWSEGLTIQCKSFAFGVIPIGVRTLHFEKIDHKNYQIQSREHDPLIARWDHLVSIKPLADTRSIYRHNRHRCRQPHLRGLGMGQLVLPSSPAPVACACKGIVTAD